MRRTWNRLVVIGAAAALAALIVGCGGKEPVTDEGTKTLKVTSTAFEDGRTIPRKYTADGEDISPPLAWSKTPEGTASIAITCDDPDAPSGTWVHWVFFNLPPMAEDLPESIRPRPELPESGARQGTNDFRQIGYGGPDPPSGKPHRYVFTVYALDVKLDLAAGATRNEFDQAIKDHILAQGKLTGTYGR